MTTKEHKRKSALLVKVLSHEHWLQYARDQMRQMLHVIARPKGIRKYNTLLTHQKD